MSELLTVAQVAATLQVAQSTVRRWVRLGALRAFRLPSGGIRISRASIDALSVAETDSSKPSQISHGTSLLDPSDRDE